MNKDKALFWLDRRIKELEIKSGPPNQEALAKAQLSYAERQMLMEKHAKTADEVKGELDALREVVAFIREKA